MRTAFIPQQSLFTTPIDEIEFDVFSRHELVPILMALQHLYVNREETVKKICKLIESDMVGDKNKISGRIGLTQWETLVLASCRLGCNLDYDQLSDLSSNHIKLRAMMGIDPLDLKRYPKSTIHDNICSLSAQTIDAITDLIVREGHLLKPNALDKVRGDSYVLQKNIHYPTDRNLLLDGIRKVIELSFNLANENELPGWRQHEYLKRKAREHKRAIDRTSKRRGKNREEQIKIQYQNMIEYSETIVQRGVDTIKQYQAVRDQVNPFVQQKSDKIVSSLLRFIGGTDYVASLARRRVIEGEKIANGEKIFSLFETDTELINRGKEPQPIEFGHRIFLIQDSAGFIIYGIAMGRGATDDKVLIEVMRSLQNRFNGKIGVATFDKGFWSKNNFDELSKIVETPVLPKKGKRSEDEAQREGTKVFGQSRKWHSGVESAIHALTKGNGLDVCRDQGMSGYERYLALGLLGRNLQTLGTILLEKERERKRKQRLQALI